ncbi:hypothetical protein XhhCFBP4925_04860 [Xanthomonas hortorum pv. hederae]|nr:hypothetical protein XhhCFBP4925_04860 [Xanthomonas hortorum pv. hederae]PUF01310.1 hypothetical protein C7T87_03805 [Xanthomonas hortorum pv. hederae]
MSPVRQLKIFYPTTALGASHQRKCANLLRSSIALHASAWTTRRMHACLASRPTIDHRRMRAPVFFTTHTPRPHDWLTPEIRCACMRTSFDAVVVMRAWRVRCFSIGRRARRWRPAPGMQASFENSATRQFAGHCNRYRRAGAAWRAKKNGRSRSGHPRLRCARRDQCASSSSSSA